jgi:inhibitor of KinA sporulation pathway (predicted exonuclease)
MDERSLLVVDLEATCWENRMAPTGETQSIHNMEIIEFGCALASFWIADRSWCGPRKTLSSVSFVHR